LFNEQAHSAIPSSYSVQDVTPLRVQDPFFDYLSISTKTNDFDDSSLEKKGAQYKIPGHFTSMDLFYNNYNKNLTVRGSFPWYNNGHDLYSSIDELKNTINDISNMIDVDMTWARVHCFELSKVFIVDFPVSLYQLNHLSLC